MRAAAFETERSIRRGDRLGALSGIAMMDREAESVPRDYVAFRYLLGSTLADLRREMESDTSRGPFRGRPITSIIALLGPRFVGRKIVAQFGGPCDVCGDPCVKGGAVMYDDATKKAAHMTCAELAT
jgi:hypothetical protein